MSTSQPSEEELRAAYEAEMQRIRVDDLLLESVVNMVNFGMRRTGLVAGTESERDPRQVQLAVETVRALLPLVETVAPEQAAPIRQALSQLQLAYVQIGGGSTEPSAAASGSVSTAATDAPIPTAPAAPPPPAPAPEPSGSRPAPPPPPEPAEPVTPGEPGPAQRSGRLWVPGQ
jgi:hypothetical protein